MCGTLAIYCGGCLLHVQERIHAMAQKLGGELGDDQPLMCVFTMGEIGAWAGGRSYLGNLMNTLLLFTSCKLVARVVEIESGRVLVEGYKNFTRVAQKNKALRELAARNERERKGRGIRELTHSRKRSSLSV